MNDYSTVATALVADCHLRFITTVASLLSRRHYDITEEDCRYIVYMREVYGSKNIRPFACLPEGFVEEGMGDVFWDEIHADVARKIKELHG